MLRRAGYAAAIAAVITLLIQPIVDGMLTEDRTRLVVRRDRPRAESARIPADAAASDPYEGLGTWIDIYDRGPWRAPARAVERMKAKGVRTLYLQTGNYSSEGPIYRPGAVARFIRAAHRRNIQVVGWYLPGFDRPDFDRRRALAALRFRGPHGERFDSIALDIEATRVASIGLRNARMLRLSRELRAAAGPSYVLGAITPDRWSLYWPGFPYERVARYYDVFLPMTYFTFRTTGPGRVRAYVEANVRRIRAHTGNPRARVHVIGGIGGRTTPSEMGGFIRAVERRRAIGASFYDFPITARHEWAALRRLLRAAPSARGRPNDPQEPRRRDRSDRDRSDRDRGDRRRADERRGGRS